ncbi:MAG: thiamine pyrophosphate-dependent dehydrogenase E1 component subunit alpha [bacterium]|nr:thiamine pyrophosphate-dependent dehydrogenase E1 component subunit alpha [bacterium]
MGLGKEKLLLLYKQMLSIRLFEDRIYQLFLQGMIPSTLHQYQGEEAIAVGVCAVLNEDDFITSTHRPHGHAIAKGIPMEKIAAELFGKVTGCCRAKGGSMHIGDYSVGMLPAIAIVGSGIPIANGVALAFKLRRTKQVVVSFFGDGATNNGSFHEALNMGAIYNLPVVYVCENNFYGASTHISKVMKLENIADRASAYGIPGVVIDGMDVLEVYKVATEAVSRARDGKGPTLIECKTYRYSGHSRSDPANYRSKEELEFWKSRDPIVLFKKRLFELNILDEEADKQIKSEVEREIEKAINFAIESPSPPLEIALEDVYA